MTFGRLLQQLREDTKLNGREMTKAELGRRVQLDGSFITRLETEERRCSESTAAKLDAALEAGGRLLALWRDSTSGTVVSRAVPGVRIPRDSPATPQLVGVDATLKALNTAAELRQPIILTGPAGCGKSVLARKWANHQAPAHPHGRLDLNARGRCSTQPPRTPAQLLVQALDRVTKSQRHHGYAEDVDRLAVQLRGVLGERRALLIIDDVCDAAQVEPLLGISGVTILMTSRSQLRELTAGLHSAYPVEVPALDHDTVVDIISIVAGPRVQGQRSALDRIAAALDGNALAARAAGLHILRSRRPLSELVDELTGADRIRHLHHAAGGTGGNTSLLTALTTSLHRLEPATQHLLATAARAGSTTITAEQAADILHTSRIDAAGRLNEAENEHLLTSTPEGHRIPSLLANLLTTTG